MKNLESPVYAEAGDSVFMRLSSVCCKELVYICLVK